MSEIRAVAFDVIETLMSLDPIHDRLSERGYSSGLFDLWFARAVRDGMALGAAGGYRSFQEVSVNALRDVTDHTVDDATIEHVLHGWDELPAYPDVEPAVQHLTASGIRIVGLTTGSAETIKTFLAHNDLGRYFETVISCETIGTWKPEAGVYRYAADRLHLAPEQVALLAAHAWDCHGAKRAGLTTGWVSRLEGRYSATFDPPDATGDDLEELVQHLLQRQK